MHPLHACARVHPADGLAGGERQADDEVLGALDQAMGTAAGRNDAEVIRLLVAHGGSVDTVDERGWTPLNVAGRLGHASAVSALLAEAEPLSRVQEVQKELRAVQEAVSASTDWQTSARAALEQTAAAVETTGETASPEAVALLGGHTRPASGGSTGTGAGTESQSEDDRDHGTHRIDYAKLGPVFKDLVRETEMCKYYCGFLYDKLGDLVSYEGKLYFGKIEHDNAELSGLLHQAL